MEQIVVRGGPEDLLAYAFFRLGYWPEGSVVLVGVHGERHRTGVVARFDLPEPALAPLVAGRGAALLSRDGADEVVVLICSEGSGAQPLRAHPDVAAVLGRALEDAGTTVLDVVAVSRRAYVSYGCRDEGCCPAGGHPFSAVLSTATAAHMVLAGRSLGGAEDDLVADVRPRPLDGPLRTAVQRRLARLEAESRYPGEVGPGRSAALGLWRDLVAQDDEVVPPAGELAALVLALQDGTLRDAVLLTLIPGAGDAPEELAAEGASGACSGALERIDVLLTAAPQAELLRPGVRVLALLARVAPRGQRADPLAVLAWLAWWSEGGARPRLLAHRALDDQPGHRLASVVDEMLACALMPPWVRQPG